MQSRIDVAPKDHPEPRGAAARRHVQLLAHPRTPCPLVRALEVTLARDRAGDLHLDFALTGDVVSLRVPEAGAPARRDGLWRHTCFEAFFAPGSGTGYREFNFSPSGDWAAYDFRGLREGVASPDLSRPPRIDVVVHDHVLRLSVSLAAADVCVSGTLHAGLTAVVEDVSGARSYFALAHPRAEPDFHDPAGFALRLDTC